MKDLLSPQMHQRGFQNVDIVTTQYVLKRIYFLKNKAYFNNYCLYERNVFFFLNFKILV